MYFARYIAVPYFRALDFKFLKLFYLEIMKYLQTNNEERSKKKVVSSSREFPYNYVQVDSNLSLALSLFQWELSMGKNHRLNNL